jgi:hypothetical protein
VCTDAHHDGCAYPDYTCNRRPPEPVHGTSLPAGGLKRNAWMEMCGFLAPQDVVNAPAGQPVA